MSDYWFFLSYARRDKNDLLKRFYRDLANEVGVLAAEPSKVNEKEIGFLDYEGIEVGTRWPESLTEALQSSKAFVCLYSPSYFNSEVCGKEFQVFYDRVDVYSQRLPKGSVKPNLIFPVLWESRTRLPQQLPEIVDHLNYVPAACPEIYAREGLHYMLRTGCEKEYNQFIIRFTDQIWKAVKVHKLAKQGDIPPLEKTPNAFRSAVKPIPEKPKPLKYALLVQMGNSEVVQEGTRSSEPPCEIEGLKQVLEESGEHGFIVTVLTNPTVANFEGLLRDLVKQVGQDDTVLIYFKGCCAINRDDGVCLCVSDTDLERIDTTSIRLRWTQQKIIDKIKATQIAIILDCSYTRVDHESSEIDVATALQDDLGKGKGKYVITSSTAFGETSGTKASESNLFVKYFVEGLRTWKADLSKDGIITLEELYHYVEERVLGEMGERPRKWDFSVPAGQIEICRREEVNISPVHLHRPIPSEFLDSVRSRWNANKVIPFLGDGIYGTGPLSTFQIVAAMAERNESLKRDIQYPLATATEYVQQVHQDDREDFLGEFKGILEDQSAGWAGRKLLVHDLILAMKPPWLVVSTTYDEMLERRLEQEGRNYVVVAHILHSREGRDDGKLLVVRRGKEPSSDTPFSDKLLLSENEKEPDCVIYKVLGSPFLHRYVEKEREIDTVVITETDHVKFLTLLQNQHTKVPDAFSLDFKRRSLLFLGYNLDVWHYRLIGQIFARNGVVRTGENAFGVRQPTSPMEAQFWKRLKTDLLPVDPETFVQALRS